MSAQPDVSGIVTLEVRHNTLVIMEAGVQESWEHRIFKPNLSLMTQTPQFPFSKTPPHTDPNRTDNDPNRRDDDFVGDVEPHESACEQAAIHVAPRINLTFHVHKSSS